MLKPETRSILRGLGSLGWFSFRAAPARSSFIYALWFARYGTTALTALGLQRVTNGLTQQTPADLNLGVTLLAGAVLLSMSTTWVGSWLRWGLHERTQLMIESELAALISGIPTLEHHERPDYLKEVDLLRQNIFSVTSLPELIIARVGNVAQIVTTLILLAGVHPALILLPLFGLPSLRIAVLTAAQTRRKNEEIVEPRRLGGILYHNAVTPHFGKEVRLFGLAEELISRYLSVHRDFDRVEERTQVTNAVWTAAGWSFFAVGFVGAVGLVAARVASGGSNLGELVLTMTLASRVNSQVAGLAGGISAFAIAFDAARRWDWLRTHKQSMDETLGRQEPPDRLVSGIEFRDVTFRYPGTDAAVLENVNAKLPAASTIAIVGDNGAGKTTLVKLLCGFYEPTGGQILVDGVPLKDLSLEGWRRDLSAAFQDFVRFELVARESVGVGHLAIMQDPPEVEAALERAHAAELAGELPHGLETQLGRSFDEGVELSAGQWQKLALGRAMMRVSPLLLLLDEPTASLDAVTEHALFDRYAKAAHRSADARGSVTIVVSHRFSTVRMADLILVVDKGKVVEQGTHEQLMALEGLYCQLYRLQSQAYIE